MMTQAHNINREQWRGLYRAWRTALRSMTLPQAAAWVAFYSMDDAALLLKIHNGWKRTSIVVPHMHGPQWGTCEHCRPR